jgi:adenylate kinase family enzyme
METLSAGYGKNNVYVFFLNLPDSNGESRNVERKLCSSCKLVILNNNETEHLTKCVNCAAPLETRTTLDNPRTYANRLLQFKEKTLPLLDELKARDYIVHEIQANKPPFEIHKEILDILF